MRHTVLVQRRRLGDDRLVRLSVAIENDDGGPSRTTLCTSGLTRTCPASGLLDPPASRTSQLRARVRVPARSRTSKELVLPKRRPDNAVPRPRLPMC